MSPLIVGITGGIYGKKNKYVPIFRFCDILICFGTLSMSFRMCRLALLWRVLRSTIRRIRRFKVALTNATNMHDKFWHQARGEILASEA